MAELFAYFPILKVFFLKNIFLGHVSDKINYLQFSVKSRTVNETAYVL